MNENKLPELKKKTLLYIQKSMNKTQKNMLFKMGMVCSF